MHLSIEVKMSPINCSLDVGPTCTLSTISKVMGTAIAEGAVIILLGGHGCKSSTSQCANPGEQRVTSPLIDQP